MKETKGQPNSIIVKCSGQEVENMVDGKTAVQAPNVESLQCGDRS